MIGIDNLLDDAAIQQFVNSKTNKPVYFSYKNLEFENKKIALISIPVQQRPIYLKSDFGKLKKEKVYLRRGSTTVVAQIDEIAKMGIRQIAESARPDLKMHFAKPKTRSLLPNGQIIKSMVLEIPKMSMIPDYQKKDFNNLLISLLETNSSYYRELASFTKINQLVSPFYFALENSGNASAKDVRIEIKISKSDGMVQVMDAYQYPNIPESSRIRHVGNVELFVKEHDLKVSDIGSEYVIEGRVNKLQAKEWYWFRSPIYVGGNINCQVLLKIQIYSDELSSPKQQQLCVIVESIRRKVDLQDICALEAERFKGSSKFKSLSKMHFEEE